MPKKGNPIAVYPGFYGDLWAKRTRALNPGLYQILEQKGKLDEYLRTYQDAFAMRARTITADMEAKQGVDDALLARNYTQYLIESYAISMKVRKKLRDEILTPAVLAAEKQAKQQKSG